MNSEQLMATTGLTHRQLTHWVRRGWLRPVGGTRGTGYAHEWPRTEVEAARIMVRLVKAGLTPDAAHRVARGEAELAPGVRVLVEAVAS